MQVGKLLSVGELFWVVRFGEGGPERNLQGIQAEDARENEQATLMALLRAIPTTWRSSCRGHRLSFAFEAAPKVA